MPDAIVFHETALLEILRGDETEDVLRDIGDDLVTAVRKRIGYVTGRGKESVSVETGRDEDGVYADIYAIWYLRYPDKGTRYMRPQNIFDEAIDEVASK
jgi:HK97 gp10 family phage protein